ncbi:hypothetical protein BGZ76_001204 [Entomortierella beljakovae]|nr:hypothetical protein BGZ76_001204 [Entomortierella beljakovae]
MDNNINSEDMNGNKRAIAPEPTDQSPLIALGNPISCNHEPVDKRHEDIIISSTTEASPSVTSSISETNNLSSLPNTNNKVVDTKTDSIPTLLAPDSLPNPTQQHQHQQQQHSQEPGSSSSSSSSSTSTFSFSTSTSTSTSSSTSPIAAVSNLEESKQSNIVNPSFLPDPPINPNPNLNQSLPLMNQGNDQTLDVLKGQQSIPSETREYISNDTPGLTTQKSPLKESLPLPRVKAEDARDKILPPTLDVHSNIYSSSSFVTSSASSPSTTTSSLSEYLIIGQEQAERDDSDDDDDQHSDHSCHGSQGCCGDDSDASLDSHLDDLHFHAQSQPQPRKRRNNHHRASFVQDSENEIYSHEFSDGYIDEAEHSTPFIPLNQQRITDAATDKIYKRTSLKQKRDSNSSSQGQTDASVFAMPALKVPSVRGMTKSVIEFVVASAMFVTLMTCVFAFSYASTSTTRLLGWYSDQQIGQRIREGLKEREFKVQEALEKMAGEEYANVKRRSQQYQQQYQQNYGNPYQQRYQQEREQRQQQKQQQQQQGKQGLSTAEWQDLIRAASISFIAKFSKPTPPLRARR